MLRLYDFKCSCCKHKFEDLVEHQNSNPIHTLCPKCNGVSFKIPSTYNFVIHKVRYDSTANRWDYSGANIGEK